MKKYFYLDGSDNLGPYTLEELKERNITRETKVWFQELGEWKPAGSLCELDELFKVIPPPINNYESSSIKIRNQSTGQKLPKNWLVESILVTLFCCLPFGIAGIVNAAKVESLYIAGDIDGAINASKAAEKWTTIGFWIGLVVGVIYLIVILASAAGGL